MVGAIQVASTLEDHFAAVTALKEFAARLLGLHAPEQTPALVCVTSTWSSQEVSHPRTIQAQCCLTSVFKWDLAFPTWHAPLTYKVEVFCRFN